jgi:alkaline phosphatase
VYKDVFSASTLGGNFCKANLSIFAKYSSNMKYALSLTVAGALLAQGASALWLLPTARNFIYIVPDGYGQASQTMARDYVSLLQNGENPKAPVSIQLPADQMVIGNVRTQASNNLITDSAASATAFGCGVKTYNNGVCSVCSKIGFSLIHNFSYCCR